MRETLFNWLHQDLTGQTCLDLYAGSGALGFEAASRGATRVVQVESNGDVCAALQQNVALLQAKQIEVAHREVMRYLAGPPRPFDIIFLDPPFQQGLITPCCLALEQRGWLADTARIYIEAEAGLVLEGLPENWHSLRAKRAGEVGYHLYGRNAPQPYPASPPP